MQPLFEQDHRVVLFDFSNVVFRACAVGGEYYLSRFCSMMINYRKRFGFRSFIHAIEGRGTDERRKIFPGYKDGRVPTEEILDSRKTCLAILRCTNCSIIKAPRGEADDAIGTYLANEPSRIAVVVTEDKDLWQLIRPSRCLVHSKKRGTVTPETVRSVMKVPPSKIPLHKAVFGDASDGLPRVPRVPSKVLLKLVQSTTTPQELLREARGLRDSQAKAVLQCKRQIKMNYKLAMIQKELPLRTKKYTADEEKLRRRLRKHGVTDLTEKELGLLMGRKNRKG